MTGYRYYVDKLGRQVAVTIVDGRYWAETIDAGEVVASHDGLERTLDALAAAEGWTLTKEVRTG